MFVMSMQTEVNSKGQSPWRIQQVYNELQQFFCIMQQSPFRLCCCPPPAASSLPCSHTVFKKEKWIRKRTTSPLLKDRQTHTWLLGGFSIDNLSVRVKTHKTLGCLPALPGNLLFTETMEQDVTRPRGHQGTAETETPTGSCCAPQTRGQKDANAGQ